MTQRRLLLWVMFLGGSLVFARPAEAQRSSAIIGFGIGPGVASYSAGFSGTRDTKIGVATDFHLGGVIGDGLELYFMSKLIFHEAAFGADFEWSGVTGIGLTYPLDSDFYINGGVGLGVWKETSLIFGPSGSESGLGLVAGGGYELSGRFVLDADITYANLDNFSVLGFKLSINIVSH